MNDLTLERYQNNARLRMEIQAAARRERAWTVKRFLDQAAQVLLGHRRDALPARGAHTAQPCEAC